MLWMSIDGNKIMWLSYCKIWYRITLRIIALIAKQYLIDQQTSQESPAFIDRCKVKMPLYKSRCDRRLTIQPT